MDPVTPNEYEASLRYWIQYTQRQEYATEWKALGKNQPVGKKSPLAQYTPFRDPDNCIRLRGRLSNAEMSYNQQHPYLLPASSILARRLMEEAHQKTLHGHMQICLQYLRDKYWIIGARNAMRKIIHSCPRCLSKKN